VEDCDNQPPSIKVLHQVLKLTYRQANLRRRNLWELGLRISTPTWPVAKLCLLCRSPFPTALRFRFAQLALNSEQMNAALPLQTAEREIPCNLASNEVADRQMAEFQCLHQLSRRPIFSSPLESRVSELDGIIPTTISEHIFDPQFS
jgi:hypothetical protein